MPLVKDEITETTEGYKGEIFKRKNTNEFIPFPNKEVKFRMTVNQAGQPKGMYILGFVLSFRC